MHFKSDTLALHLYQAEPAVSAILALSYSSMHKLIDADDKFTRHNSFSQEKSKNINIKFEILSHWRHCAHKCTF